MQVLQLCTGTIPRVIGVERFGKGSTGAAVSWVEGHFLESISGMQNVLVILDILVSLLIQLR